LEDCKDLEVFAEALAVRPRKQNKKPEATNIPTNNIAEAARRLERAGKLPSPLDTAEQTTGKANLAFRPSKPTAAPKTIDNLRWYSKEELAKHNYGHYFEDPMGPLRTWTMAAAEKMYQSPGYHFLVQRVGNRGNAARDNARDRFRDELAKALGCEVKMETMGSCKAWLWLTVEERENVMTRLANTAIIRLRGINALYVIRQFARDTRIRHLILKTHNVSVGDSFKDKLQQGAGNSWEVLGLSKFSKIWTKAIFCLAEDTEWDWDLPWDRVPGSLHPPIPYPGLTPTLMASKPYECQLCYNEDHNARECPLVDITIDNEIMIPKQSQNWVLEKKIPNSRSVEVWPPAETSSEPKTTGIKRKADNEDTGTRKRLRFDIDTPAAPTPTNYTIPLVPSTPIIRRVYDRLVDEHMVGLTEGMELHSEPPVTGEDPPVDDDEDMGTEREPSPHFSTAETVEEGPGMTADEARRANKTALVGQFPAIKAEWIERCLKADVNKKGSMTKAIGIMFVHKWDTTQERIKRNSKRKDVDTVYNFQKGFLQRIEEKKREKPTPGGSGSLAGME